MPEPKRLDLPRIKERDEEALRGLFDLLLPRLLRQARVYSRAFPLGGLDIDDLAQSALLKIYTHLDKAPLDDEARFLAWCNVIAKHLVLDSVKTLRRRALECDYYDTVAEVQRSAAAATPEPTEVRLLETLLKNLSQEDRELVLVRSSGKTLAEIAKASGVSRATLYRRYRSIVDGLRERLKSELQRK